MNRFRKDLLVLESILTYLLIRGEGWHGIESFVLVVGIKQVVWY